MPKLKQKPKFSPTVLVAVIIVTVVVGSYLVLSSFASTSCPSAWPPASNAHWTGCPTLSYGSSGTNVRTLQRLLNYFCKTTQKITVDGSFGPITKNRVKGYQKSHPFLQVDGIVGPRTWGAFTADWAEGVPAHFYNCSY